MQQIVFKPGVWVYLGQDRRNGYFNIINEALILYYVRINQNRIADSMEESIDRHYIIWVACNEAISHDRFEGRNMIALPCMHLANFESLKTLVYKTSTKTSALGWLNV
jgi:hypothetical protein